MATVKRTPKEIREYEVHLKFLDAVLQLNQKMGEDMKKKFATLEITHLMVNTGKDGHG